MFTTKIIPVPKKFCLNTSLLMKHLSIYDDCREFYRLVVIEAGLEEGYHLASMVPYLKMCKKFIQVNWQRGLIATHLAY